MRSSVPDARSSVDGTSCDDAAILADLSRGIRETFQSLVDRYKGPLYRYLLCQTARADVAEDLAQEVFLRVFRAASAGAFAGRSGVKTWVFTIARNCLHDHWRSRQRRADISGSEQIELHAQGFGTSETGPAENAIRAERLKHILRTLKELPPEQCEVAHLRFFGGLTMPEISEITGAPLPTVKARLRYALAKLADKLTPHRGDL